MPGHAKQPDSSFCPVLLPAPTRQNNLMYQPNTTLHFLTLVFEMAVTNENRERLVSDAADKYFSVHTSVQCWMGLKIDINGREFWAAWGRRRLAGYGLRLEEQTEDVNGEAIFITVDPPAPLVGQFTIPGALIFHPLSVPAGLTPNLVIPLEAIRSQVEIGLSEM